MKNSKKKMRYLLLITAVVVGLIGYAIVPVYQNLNYGLDLKGGFEVLYQVKPIEGKTKVSTDMVNSTYHTILKRIDVLGVSEPEITIEGNDKIRVRLAGVTNQEEARNILSKAANLTFRDTHDNLLMSSDVLKSGGVKLASDDRGLPAVALPIKDNDTFYKVTDQVSKSTDNTIVIWLDFDPNTDSYQTEKNNCGSLGTSRCLSAAGVDQAFSGDVIIRGNFTREEATSLADLINSGSLPTKLEEISSRTVEASFDADSLNKTLISALVGIGLITLILVFIYRFAGLITAFTLVIYSFLVFLIFYLVGGVLTLPGIAAVLLGIGMAVDANVITFERIKEELLLGRDLKSAYNSGNHNSFATILDANITTIIVAIILFIFGESSIKGFATMLIINIFITVLSMIFINRSLLKMFVKTGYFNDKLKIFIGLNNNKIQKLNNAKVQTKFHFDYVKIRWITMGISALIIVIGFIFIGCGRMNLGIDFKGGSDITVMLNGNVTADKIDLDIKTLGYKIDKTEVYDDVVSVKIKDILSKKEIDYTTKYFNDKYNAKTDVSVVSQTVKKDLTVNAIYALIIASFFIVLYVSFRFKFSYAISAIVALLHDVLIIVAFFSITGLEVSNIFIAAALTIIGYSINDTIVIFDRIRENLKNYHKNKVNSYQDLVNIVNLSLNQTLIRTLYTTMTTLIPVICLVVFGAIEILNFNIALLVGLVAGVYSSIFIAAQLWLMLEKRNIGKDMSKRSFTDLDTHEEIDELTIKGVNS